MFGSVLEQLESSVTSVDELVALIEELTASLESEDLDRDEALATLLALERLSVRLRTVIGSFATDLEARDAHRADAASSMADWMAARTGERRATTGSRLFLARELRSMPQTAAALREAAITESHASVLARALNPRTAEAFARDEAMLVGHAKKLTADQLVEVIEFWLRRHDPDGAERRRTNATGSSCPKPSTGTSRAASTCPAPARSSSKPSSTNT